MVDDQVDVLARIVRVLADVGARHALVGGHAVSAHTRPRLTIDVDLIVDSRRRVAIENALRQAGFVVRAERDVLRVLKDIKADAPIADLWLSDSHPVWMEALRSAVDGDYQVSVCLSRRLPLCWQ
jgi:hypothetical protein